MVARRNGTPLTGREPGLAASPAALHKIGLAGEAPAGTRHPGRVRRRETPGTGPRPRMRLPSSCFCASYPAFEKKGCHMSMETISAIRGFKDILPGELWVNSIQTAIQNSDFFLACLSKNSVDKRGMLQKEIKARHIRNCAKADPAYGEGVAKALGIPMRETEIPR